MRKKLPLLVFIVSLSLHPLLAHAQTGIAGGALASTVISDFEKSIKSIIDKIENTYSSSAFVTREQLQILIWELNAMGEGLVGKTFSELKLAQRDFLKRVQSTIAEWNSGNQQALKQIDELLVRSNDVLGTIPGAYRKPRVTGYNPAYLDAREKNFTVRIEGSWLGNGEPTLSIGGTACKRAGMIESELSFLCRLSPGSATRITTQVANLTVYKTPSSLWGRTLLWVGLEDLTPKKYEIPLVVVPPVLGRYTMNLTREQETREAQHRAQDFSHQNDHCQGSRDQTWNFSASSGWRLDPNSARVSHDKNSESSWSGIDNLTEAGFQVKATVRNQGSCAPEIFGHRAFVDGRGKVWGRADWDEYRFVQRQSEEQGPAGIMEWGKDIEIPLPPGTKSYAVTVRQADGSQHVATGPESRKWFLLVDETPARLVLRPKALRVALAD